MNIRRKNRLWIACAVLAGLALNFVGDGLRDALDVRLRQA